MKGLLPAIGVIILLTTQAECSEKGNLEDEDLNLNRMKHTHQEFDDEATDPYPTPQRKDRNDTITEKFEGKKKIQDDQHAFSFESLPISSDHYYLDTNERSGSKDEADGSCPDLEAPENGKVIVRGRMGGDKAHFECNQGFAMEGSPEVTCQLGQYWNGTVPICSKPITDTIENSDQLTGTEYSVVNYKDILRKLESWIQPTKSQYIYCKFGGHLEYLSIRCKQKLFLSMTQRIRDTETPPEYKLIATAVSAVAVGCKESALFLGKSMAIDLEKADRCHPTIIEGPEENKIYPCDSKIAEQVRNLFNANTMLNFTYYSISYPIFLTLGCHNLANSSANDFFNDLYVNNSILNNDIKNTLHTNLSYTSKALLKIKYIYQHKSDTRETDRAKALIKEMTKNDKVNSYTSTDNSDIYNYNDYKRIKRTTNDVNDNIEQYFLIKQNCSIGNPLGVTIDSLTEQECLQLCFGDNSCRSTGYNRKFQECHLNTEIESEVGSLFTCQQHDSAYWDYFEKHREVVSFFISSKVNGHVLQVLNDKSVMTAAFNGDDSQLWFWKDDAIFSKMYPTKSLTITDLLGKKNIILDFYAGLNYQKWNFENENLVSQFNNLTLGIEHSFENDTLHITISPTDSSIGQRWSLHLDRYYFVLTCRKSGKVLDASLKNKGHVHMWSYHGGDNQLWFWDDDNIRSKKFPDKVLDLHMLDFSDKGWGKVYLHTFHGGENQRWKTKEDYLVSNYKDLRLDVKNGNNNDGADVGGCYRNGNSSQRWSFGTYRTYFFILNKKSGRVMDASSPSEIKQWHYNGGANQIWFWDSNVIRNKKYPDKVIDFEIDNYMIYGQSKLFLNLWQETISQMWEYKDMLLLSAYQNLSVSVEKNSLSDGAMFFASGSKIQNWSFNLEHDFFTITSRQTSKVLDASLKSEGQVHMWTYHGDDNQLWFWDDDSIRSKKFPDKVLDLHMLDYSEKGWGKVYLHPFHGGKNQRWKTEGDYFFSEYKKLHLDIRHSSPNDGADVGGYPETGNLNQMWSLNLKERIYFNVKGVQSGKVLTVFDEGAIRILPYKERDNQLWFWDQTSIRSKMYPAKVIDLHVSDFYTNSWGKIYLHPYHGGENQQWKVDGENIICEFSQLYLDVYEASTKDGALVGGYAGKQSENQKWILSAFQKGDCLDQTENDIYSVVEWIPLISTVWDLYSSIGYAAAGCTSVAEERAISFSIGIAMDAASVATAGAAGGLAQIIKTGVRVGIKIGLKEGIKYGLKEGIKAAYVFTKQSFQSLVRNALNKIADIGIRKTFTGTLSKAGMLLIQETITDPALFLKNAGKLSLEVLTHPKLTFQQFWKAALKHVDNLKQLKTSFEELRGISKHLADGSDVSQIRCRRGGILSCARKGRTSTVSLERDKYQLLLQIQEISGDLNTFAHRFLTLNAEMLEGLPSNVRERVARLSSDIDKAEVLAVYKYTENSEVNWWVSNILENEPISRDKKFFNRLAEDKDGYFYHAALIQSYLTKRPLPQPKTVYRFETIIMDKYYQNEGILTTKKFMSTLQDNKRIKDTGIKLDNKRVHPIEMTIHLKKSGTDISDLSKYPAQNEVLIPMGTKFRVQKKIISSADEPLIQITLTEI